MLFIILGMVDPLRFLMIEIISMGVEKMKLFENLFKMVIDNLRLLIVKFILRGCEMMVISSISLHFFQPRIP